MFIPFGTDRKTVYFYSRVPTLREITECTHIAMTGDTEWYPHSVRLASVSIKEVEESHNINEISQSPKVHNLETDRIMGSIGDVLMERSMM